MATTIAIANQKGGVAKTTTAAALAVGLKNKGYRVLAVDGDPQANLSTSVDAEINESDTLYDLLKSKADVRAVIQHLDCFDIIPANIMLAGAEPEITQTGKEYRLREELEPVVGDYDFIVVDTPPSLGLLTINAFTAADEIIIPSTAGIFAATGISQLYETIRNITKYCNPSIRISGILMTRHNPRTNIGKDMKEITERLGSHIDAPLYKTYIRNSVTIEEAQANKVDIFTYSGGSQVAQDYQAFVEEYLERHSGKEKA